ncbi:response regulator transcription factor [Aliarcobacter lanthieri]|uniref:response regulator transcription factor n=1 Tax=Aliarcobacter lanthieri TaxID=1355374 RepID=UPI00047D42CC|nr:response regulator transcription factor [Aliarcobacter lanthieri]QKF58548.1 two-component system response regulator [Aliarcobacter lanthieri]
MKKNFLNKLNAFTVLYVEDEDGIRKNIEEILKHLFKEVYSASNVTDANSLYLQHKPDLIITDIRMGNETGIDFIKSIRQTDSKTRVIITSAFTDLDYLLKATELYLVKYIVKPITNDNLMEALEAFIKSYDENKIYVLDESWFFDSSKSLVSNGEFEAILTKKEVIFLKLLITKNRIITYEELENAISEDSVLTPNAMRLFIKNLRKKLPDNFLKNMQGVGYYCNNKSI